MLRTFSSHDQATGQRCMGKGSSSSIFMGAIRRVELRLMWETEDDDEPTSLLDLVTWVIQLKRQAPQKQEPMRVISL
jgi:hypothetical protein